MINRFKNKLRLSGIEDQLQRDLQITRTASAWLSRLAFDLAQKTCHDLLSTAPYTLTSSVFWQIERSGHSELLDALAKDHDTFCDELQRYRTGRAQQAA